jgi:hypothetical protein
MSDTCETVKIVDENAPGGHVIINKSDFNEDEHELFDESAGLSSKTKAELVEMAEAAGIETKGKTKADLIEALTPAE